MKRFLAAAWPFERGDRRALLLIALVPLLLALPLLVGLLKADPILYHGGITLDYTPGLTKGVPYIDPNNAVSTHALGRLAAWQWLHGMVPWWNYYSGVGLPLAAEYQAGAFFPLTILLMLPYGMAWMQVVLQILAGWGTYGLLRRLGVGRMAATTGGLLYAFNGTLAWFAHAPAAPVPFLPWMLWGVERIYQSVRDGTPVAWGLLAASMAMMLLASFPETAYLSGLLALAWTVVRGVQLRPEAWRAYSRAIVLGGLCGIAIAAPQVYSFLEYLPHADVGGHETRFATEAMSILGIPSSLFTPYFFGPIFAYAWGSNEWVYHIWGGMGGYVTIALAVAAFAGFWSRRDAVGWLLLGWIVLTLARTFGVPGTPAIWNWIPGVSLAAFYRYACPSWELAFVLLAARGLDTWSKAPFPPRAARLAALAALAVGIATFGWVVIPNMVPRISYVTPLRNAAIISTAIAFGCAFAVAVLIGRGARGVKALSILLVVEAALMYVIPTLSNPRGGRVDLAAVAFLREHLGFHRFYTVGPLQPNYGAYFRLGSVNYNYLPNSKRWHDWVKANLDQGADSVVFNGTGQILELNRNLAAYAEAGVRFVMAPVHRNPFTDPSAARRVYTDAILDIYEIPGVKPYFEAVGDTCKLEAPLRWQLVADCTQPTRLIRRELFHPGWTATVGGKDAPIAEHNKLFQVVELPAGRSEIRYAYAPPHVTWAWLAALLGLAALAAQAVRRAPRWEARSRSAT